MRKILWLIPVLFVAIGAPAIYADTMYSYVGNDFTSCSGFWYPTGPTTCQGQLQLSFETTLTGSALDNLTNDNISATLINGNAKDGNPFTGAIFCLELNECDNVFNGSGFFSVMISTNAVGQITSWDINANNANDGAGVTSNIVSSSSVGDSGAIDTFNPGCDPSFGACNGQGSVPVAGSWSGPVPAPEPGSSALALVGAGLVISLRKRIRQNRAG